MANKIILKKSSVASKVPLTSDLEVGELAVNLNDKKLYSKDISNNIIELGGGGGLQGYIPVLTHSGSTVDVDMVAGTLPVLTHSGSTVNVIVL